MTSFEFNNQPVPQSLVEIEEIGEFGLEASNDDGYCWYLVVKSCLGIVTISTCGPLMPDVEMIPSGFKMTLDKMPYNAQKLTGIIDRFLNDPKKGLTSAETLPIEDAIEQFRELKTYLLNFSEDTF